MYVSKIFVTIDEMGCPHATIFLNIIKGSDPRVATCRGKLQNKRSKLNLEINKELRLRAGAENLFRATNNRKLKETVALELSFVNSNLQLLKEQLAELNSSVEIYQGDSSEPVMPMIPLGLKETKEIDFSEPFKDFILEHYSEEGSNYEDAIAEFMDMRQSMRSPNRDPSGIALLLQYYNQLYFVERRFFPPDRTLPIYFEWYDSLTGVPSCQRTVAFEKACVLFNTGALYTQVGIRDRAQGKLESAVDSLLQAAGTFSYLAENFTNAPTMDLQPKVLAFLSSLMMAQARECLYEKLERDKMDKKDHEVYFDLAQEASQLVEEYKTVRSLMEDDYSLPESWPWLIQVKAEYYAGLSFARTGAGVLRWLDAGSSRLPPSIADAAAIQIDSVLGLATKHQSYTTLGVGYLKAAIGRVEEAARLQRMCRELRSKKSVEVVLRDAIHRLDCDLSRTKVDNHLLDLVDPTLVPGKSKYEMVAMGPDFGRQKVEDLFYGLGPLAVFSAKHYWTAPRTLQLQATRDSGDSGRFGFSVSTDCPVVVTSVQPDSLAQLGGIKEGDYIVAIGDVDVKWLCHDQVVKLIKESGDTLTLKLVTPMDRQNKTPSPSKNTKKAENVSPTNSGSSHKKLSWNPFKKYKEREAAFNIILR